MPKVARSHITTRKQCNYKRYMATEVNGHGVQPLEGEWVKDEHLARTRGQLIHGMAQLEWQSGDWKSWLKNQCEQLFDAESRAVHETLLRRSFMGWLLVRYPFYKDHFTLISAEKEWTWEVGGGLEIPMRMDTIIRRDDDWMPGIMDFKTMKSPDINWPYRMKHDDQTMIYVKALYEKLNEPVMGICYEGLILGEWKDGQQRSPLVMGYRNKKTGKISPKWAAGTDRVSLLDYTDEAWLEWMVKADALNDLYCTTGFCLPTYDQLERHKVATQVAELEWFGRMEQVKKKPELVCTIERDPSQCLKFGWGHACPYYQHCWEGMGLDAFEARKDHHSESED